MYDNIYNVLFKLKIATGYYYKYRQELESYELFVNEIYYINRLRLY
jgi:hypothetical protein